MSLTPHRRHNNRLQTDAAIAWLSSAFPPVQAECHSRGAAESGRYVASPYAASYKHIMHLEHFASRFQKLSQQRELNYSLSGPASHEEIIATEGRLGVSFPVQVKLFYQNFNGLRVADPRLEVFPLEQLNFASPNRLHFATLNGDRPLYFDVSHLNAADQWDIVAADGYRVTLTMASFWSNKIWAWVEKRRSIWQDERAT